MKPERPKLILIFGLPGTGKSTLAAALANQLVVDHLNTDMVREQLGKRGQYLEGDRQFIYDELLRLTAAGLASGNTIIVDGTFFKSSLRTPFILLAKRTGAAAKWIQVCASEEVVKERVSKKRRFSEADYAVYMKIASEFEPLEDSSLIVFSDREGLDEIIEKSLSYINQ